MSNNWKIQVFYDGECPLCRREIGWLQRRNTTNRVWFTDISAPVFDPSACGLDDTDLMAKIHGRLPDDTILVGIEVFRRVYDALGFSWLVRMSRWPGIRHALQWGYTRFAANRLKWTGRCAGPDACDIAPTRGTTEGEVVHA